MRPQNNPVAKNRRRDGRAANDFSGVGVFGQANVRHNPAARLVVRNGSRLELTALALPDARLASQAVGPPLSRVLDFYRHAGNRRDASLTEPDATGDDSGTGLEGEGLVPPPGPDHGSNAAGTLNVLGISDQGADDIIEFLKALTERQVQCDAAPFDHPELLIPVAHTPTASNNNDRADDVVFRLPEVGISGYGAGSGLCLPNAGDLFATGMQARLGGAAAPPP